jgi:hypothetical protein
VKVEGTVMNVMGGPACQSCGSPMMNAKDHGGGRADNPYCRLCTNANGDLLPYDEVHRNMAQERFAKVNKMPAAGAAEAAHRALAQMGVWKGRR